MGSANEVLTWLLAPPQEFRAAAKSIEQSIPTDIDAIRRLAATAMNIDQLRRFAKLVAGAAEPACDQHVGRAGEAGAQILALFKETVASAKQVVAPLPHARLTERITPQGRDVTVLGAIYQVTGHVQQHVGQIILLTKQMAAQDLDLTIPRPR